MKESNLYQDFIKKIKAYNPNCFVYKIPDTANLGGKKPFDMFLICYRVPIAIEFKMTNDPTKYQSIMLNLFEEAGGISLVYIHSKMKMNDFINLIDEKIEEYLKRTGI